MTVTTAPAQTTAASETAAQLRVLAGKPRLAGRAADLSDLADGLDQVAISKDDNGWAAVDLFAAFLQEDTVGQSRLAPVARALDIAIQVLFFAPIVTTWIGLLKAVDAYRDALRLRASAGQSFLAGWMSGFDGLLSRWFYLDKVAGEVVAFIVLLVILMIIQSVYRSRRYEDEPAALYRELARALVAAERELAPLRIPSATSSTLELGKAAAAIKETAESISAVGDVANRAQTEAAAGLTALTAALDGVRVLADTTNAAAESIGQASTGLDQHLGKVAAATTAASNAEAQLAAQMTQSGDRLGVAVDGLTSGVKDSIDASQQQLCNAVDRSAAKITASVEQSAVAMSSASSRSAATIADALGAGADQVRSALSDVSVAGASYTHRVEQAADVLGRAGDAVDAIPAGVSGVAASVAGLNNQLSQLGTAIAQARAVLPTAADIPADLTRALGELSAAARSLNNAAAALQNTARARPRFSWWRNP